MVIPLSLEEDDDEPWLDTEVVGAEGVVDVAEAEGVDDAVDDAAVVDPADVVVVGVDPDGTISTNTG